MKSAQKSRAKLVSAQPTQDSDICPFQKTLNFYFNGHVVCGNR